jgi:hypothetical protein
MSHNLWISTINRLALTLPGPAMIHAWAALAAARSRRLAKLVPTRQRLA